MAISPIMHAKKPRRSPLRLRFLTYLLEEISYAICITYFSTIPYPEKWKSRRKTLYDVLLVHQFLSGKGDHVTGTQSLSSAAMINIAKAEKSEII